MNHLSTGSRLLQTLDNAISRAILIVSAVVIAGSVLVLGVFIFRPETTAEFTAGLRPSLYSAPLPDDFDPEAYDYEQVYGVAHNSGDTVSATVTALASGADVIEIDVVSMGGSLYSSHASPLPFIGANLFRGPPLEMVWAVAVRTDLVKFDLKESSPAFVDLVLDFLAARRGQHTVLVASRDPDTLLAFADLTPEVLPFYSIGDASELEYLQDNPDLVSLIEGVSIRDELVDEETVRWLDDHELFILVWTVNDIERANELIGMGVGAITTDNLSLLALFGGQLRGEETDPPSATPAPTTIVAVMIGTGPAPATTSRPQHCQVTAHRKDTTCSVTRGIPSRACSVSGRTPWIQGRWPFARF